MNRLRRGLSHGLLWTLLLIALVILVALLGMARLRQQVSSSQLSFLEGAIRRSAVQCYALEGRYPENLAYLEQHYGLTLDRAHYVFHYEHLGGNLLPQIAVFPLTP